MVGCRHMVCEASGCEGMWGGVLRLVDADWMREGGDAGYGLAWGRSQAVGRRVEGSARDQIGLGLGLCEEFGRLGALDDDTLSGGRWTDFSVLS